ncbi:bifunctional Delta(1)-pyrroline-2-carboxylate/Delta(1)-piperideine-2-carboxylate reductase [Novispirillum itersonii]|uniref:Ornithine cyclodeaminase n=1 Tax=Novispirillum itersonii TaxID=189 RepID=A0A7X0DP20_NOVIT|nr:ornithine cyclodeaminase family protein [Novispirillum itersonii]MBB6211924.1 ornithine cyclodeaminase [Novispirillum itersonii]
MQFADAAAVAAALTPAALVEALRDGFRQGCEMPVRHHHTVQVPGEAAATLLLMPAWIEGGFVGVKVVSVFPGNADRGQPSIYGSYLLSSGKTGELLAVMDGPELTSRRTAAASALAADYLARKDAATLLVVGTGRLSAHMARAHAAVRPLTRVLIWGRNPEKAAAVVAELADLGVTVEVAPASLEQAVGVADIISCVTLSTQPLIQGAWLRPGQHLDLVGGFTPAMREADDEAIRRASVYVDTRAGATKEGGDIVQPLASGALTAEGIRGDLYDLCRGTAAGRGDDQEITFFKSVGCALEDLMAAVQVYRVLSA